MKCAIELGPHWLQQLRRAIRLHETALICGDSTHRAGDQKSAADFRIIKAHGQQHGTAENCRVQAQGHDRTFASV